MNRKKLHAKLASLNIHERGLMKPTLLHPPILAIALISAPAMASAISGSATVAGTANIFAAGQTSPSVINSDGSLPPFIALASGATSISFPSGTGTVHIGDPGNPAYGPESPNFTTAFFIGDSTIPVSDIRIDRTGSSLWGVFLDDSTPTGSHPVSLDFSSGGLGIAFTSLSPLLRQTFFVGDGLTGTGSGDQQTFFVPDGATRLYLGVLDAMTVNANAGPGNAYFNNTGAFNVGYDMTVNAVPEPETWAMLLAGLGLMGWRAQRRRALLRVHGLLENRADSFPAFQ
ncbi:MAG: PEP-CTERM sorting domain-containing protein [Deltaproteobacteria bacterium]|nr:PEP-CTERM sorting domain-containing protein [Thiobacillus sp.]MDP3214597.1 PEP-CTERM sorting domain-containing protein [Deltaproteobacteria bacterium]